MALPEEWYDDPTISLQTVLNEYDRITNELESVNAETKEQMVDVPKTDRRGFVKVWVVHHNYLPGSAINPICSYSVDAEDFVDAVPEIKMIILPCPISPATHSSTRLCEPEYVEEYDSTRIDPIMQKMYDDLKHLRDLGRRKNCLSVQTSFFKCLLAHWCKISGHNYHEVMHGRRRDEP